MVPLRMFVRQLVSQETRKCQIWAHRFMAVKSSLATGDEPGTLSDYLRGLGWMFTSHISPALEALEASDHKRFFKKYRKLQPSHCRAHFERGSILPSWPLGGHYMYSTPTCLGRVSARRAEAVNITLHRQTPVFQTLLHEAGGKTLGFNCSMKLISIRFLRWPKSLGSFYEPTSSS